MLFQNFLASPSSLWLKVCLTFQCCSDDVPKLIFQTSPRRPAGMLYKELTTSWHLHRINVMIVSHFSFFLVSSWLVWFFFPLRLTPHMLSLFIGSQLICFLFSLLSLKPVVTDSQDWPPVVTVMWPLWFEFAVWDLLPSHASALFPTTLYSRVMVPVTASYCCRLNLN